MTLAFTLKKWQSQDKQASAGMMLTLKYDPLNGAVLYITASEVWGKLEGSTHCDPFNWKDYSTTLSLH